MLSYVISAREATSGDYECYCDRWNKRKSAKDFGEVNLKVRSKHSKIHNYKREIILKFGTNNLCHGAFQGDKTYKYYTSQY